MCKCLLILLVLGLNLCHIRVCDGGITSSYVRSIDFSKDMSTGSDVFRVPPGYNAPQQVSFQWPNLFFDFFIKLILLL